MDTGRFLFALRAVLSAYQTAEVAPRFQEATAALEKLAAAPSSEPQAAAFVESTAVLNRAIQSLQLDSQPHNVHVAIETIGAKILEQHVLERRLRDVLSGGALSLPLLRTNLAGLRDELVTTLSLVEQAVSALDALGVQPYSTPTALTEVGIAIPQEVYQGDLDRFTSELQNWSRFLGHMTELTTGTRGQLRLAGLENGSAKVSVELDPQGALAILILIAGLYGVFGRRAGIRGVKSDAERVGLPAEVIRMIDASEDSKVQEEIEAAADRVLEHASQNLDPGRRNELGNAIRVEAKFLYKNLEAGVRIEVLTPKRNPSEATVGEAPESHAVAISGQQNLQSLSNQVNVGQAKLERGEIPAPRLEASTGQAA
jgi:hypothetical protein